MGSEIMLKKVKFSAAHFLFNHPKCGRLHGHNYVISALIRGHINQDGFVIDFQELESKLKEVAEQLDHKTLIPGYSPHIKILKTIKTVYISFGKKQYTLPGEDVSILPVIATTVELIAKYIYFFLKKEFPEFEMSINVSENKGASANFNEIISNKLASKFQSLLERQKGLIQE